jgi:hypothetical protein
MPQNVVPFKMNFRSFVISTMVIMAVANMVRLLFLASSRKPGWWRKIAAPIEIMQLSGVAHRFLTGDHGIRGRNVNDRTTDNVELPTIGV